LGLEVLAEKMILHHTMAQMEQVQFLIQSHLLVVAVVV